MEALRARTALPPATPMKQSAEEQAGTQGPPAPEAIPVIELDGAPDEASEAMEVTLPAAAGGNHRASGGISIGCGLPPRWATASPWRSMTPRATVPIFNPYLKMVDAEGAEVLTNVHSILNANTEIEKQIRPKVIHSFPRAGEFTLEIRDITAAFGGALQWPTEC